MKQKRDVREIASRVAGMHTAASLARALNVSKRTAINYICKLRKSGFVETSRGRRKIRLYRIYSVPKKERWRGLYEFISKNSKVKVVPRQEYYIHGALSVEDAIIRAVKSGDFRLVLAALGLFTKVQDWPKLNYLAKKTKTGRKVGALYELAKKVMRVRRIDKRTLNSLLNSKADNKYIIKPLRSRDFAELESKWRVYLPFNKADLKEYGG